MPVSNFSAVGLKVSFNAENPVFVEMGKNITMQWNISKTTEYQINLIKAYVQSQSIMKTLIVTLVDTKLTVYGDRLETDLDDNKFTLKATNVKFTDSGNYSVEVQVKKKNEKNVFDSATVVATVNVHGMFFSYSQ